MIPFLRGCSVVTSYSESVTRSMNRFVPPLLQPTLPPLRLLALHTPLCGYAGVVVVLLISDFSSTPTDCLVCLFPCARLIYTQSAPATCPSGDGRWCGETDTARLALLLYVCGDNMGCGDVAVPTSRRNYSAWDVQLDDISLPGFGEMAKSANAPVAQ